MGWNSSWFKLAVIWSFSWVEVKVVSGVPQGKVDWSTQQLGGGVDLVESGKLNWSHEE